MDKLTSPISEQFELLSAYLDGEVSPSERKQVEEWLETDAEFRQTYQKMMLLQEGWRSMPAVSPSMPTEQLVDQVMARLDRQPQRWIWGAAGAAVAIAIGAFSGLLGNQSPVFQTAKGPEPQPLSAGPATSVRSNAPTTVAMRASDLMLALDRPPVEIPVVPSLPNETQSLPASNF